MSDKATIYKLNPCALCESSCQRIIEVDGKMYGCCDSCYNVIKGIISIVLKEQKKK